jgi:hypothetical protein
MNKSILLVVLLTANLFGACAEADKTAETADADALSESDPHMDTTSADAVPDVGSAAPTPSCEELTELAEAFALQEIAEAQVCQTQTGCFVVPIMGDCFDVCWHALGEGGVREQIIADTNEEICSLRTDCTYGFPPCSDPPAAFTDCIDGVCQSIP